MITIKKEELVKGIINNPLHITEFYYSLAMTWMWDDCIPLGKFVDSKGNKYDLGINILHSTFRNKEYTRVSAAIVYNNKAGSYCSGDISPLRNKNDDESWQWYYEKFAECYTRANEAGLLNHLNIYFD